MHQSCTVDSMQGLCEYEVLQSREMWYDLTVATLYFFYQPLNGNSITVRLKYSM